MIYFALKNHLMSGLKRFVSGRTISFYYFVLLVLVVIFKVDILYASMVLLSLLLIFFSPIPLLMKSILMYPQKLNLPGITK
jgi:hypothetical protein